MLRHRIYVDTSVIGGCFDNEFEGYSNQLFGEFISGKKRLVISDIVLFELEEAPKNVKGILNKVPEDTNKFISKATSETAFCHYGLSAILLKERFPTSGNDIICVLTYELLSNIEYVFLNEESISLSDARHIAIATVERVDVLVSWNFKHIVNLNRIHIINSVNLKLGYPMLEIRSPMEVIYEG